MDQCHKINSIPAYSREVRDLKGSAHAADAAFDPPVEVGGSIHRILRHCLRGGTLGRL